MVAQAVKHGVWLEINSSPERLDLSGAMARTAKAKGAKFTISTDAHHPKHLAGIRYGVVTARRGWLGPHRHLEYASRGPLRGSPTNPTMIHTKSREVYQCRIFTVTEDEAHDPKTDFTIKRAIVRHRGSAVMMAVDERKCVLLVRQFRLPADKYLWELPAGTVDPGEKPLQTARRELVEETGYRARKWTKLASFCVSPGFVTERMTIYLATGLTAGEATPMDDEQIETRWFTAREMEQMIAKGKIEDAKTIVGFLMWQQLGRKR